MGIAICGYVNFYSLWEPVIYKSNMSVNDHGDILYTNYESKLKNHGRSLKYIYSNWIIYSSTILSSFTRTIEHWKVLSHCL